MINSRKMKFIKNENDINYYLFKPSVFSLYYKEACRKNKEEPSHRYSLSHKLHMILYIFMGGTRYFMPKGIMRYYHI